MREGGGPLPPHRGRALHVICEEGAVRPARLAERLHITPRSVTDVLNALEEAGYVRRGQDPGVFDSSKRPWVDPRSAADEAAADKLREVVARCPSRALLIEEHPAD